VAADPRKRNRRYRSGVGKPGAAFPAKDAAVCAWNIELIANTQYQTWISA